MLHPSQEPLELFLSKGFFIASGGGPHRLDNLSLDRGRSATKTSFAVDNPGISAEIADIGFKILKRNHKNYLAIFFQCLRQNTNHRYLGIDARYKT